MPLYQPMQMELETRRLALRPWTWDDTENYRALTAERDTRTTRSVTTARERIAAQLASAERTGIALLTVRRRAEGDFIGYCGLIVGRASVDEPEIAYELFRRVHGHGYATEAAWSVVHAAAATGRKRLWATVGSWNAPSLRVLDKLAFHRDHVDPGHDGQGEIVWLTRSLP
ncbi:MAG TPA: GNAT family N-acetyltransferase [Streptosporangiaceae bacterium]|nr:GNAT family N-acetyltransferase [Streptosporangiaceae bacterium]